MLLCYLNPAQISFKNVKMTARKNSRSKYLFKVNNKEINAMSISIAAFNQTFFLRNIKQILSRHWKNISKNVHIRWSHRIIYESFIIFGWWHWNFSRRKTVVEIFLFSFAWREMRFTKTKKYIKKTRNLGTPSQRYYEDYLHNVAIAILDHTWSHENKKALSPFYHQKYFWLKMM